MHSPRPNVNSPSGPAPSAEQLALGSAVEETAQALARCSADDPSSMAAVHTALEQVKVVSAESTDPSVSAPLLATIDTAMKLVEKIVYREASDMELEMRTLAASVNELQTLASSALPSINIIAPVPVAGASDIEETNPNELLSESDVALLKDFITEAASHIETAETALLLLEEDQTNVDAVNSVFRSFHTLKGVAGFMNLKEIGLLAHAAENILDLARNGQLAFTTQIADVILQSVDAMRKLIDLLKPVIDANGGRPARLAGLGELIGRLNEATQGHAAPVEIKSPAKVTPAAQPAAVEPVQAVEAPAPVITPPHLEHEEPSRPKDSTTSAPPASIKVSTERLDSLINLVGELVIAQAMVGQDIVGLASQDRRVARNLAHLSKITRELQDHSMAMRMVPIQGVFQKMARLVRDLARKAGKEIELVLHGGETELDRNVVEAISDPLVHMVRNSADHGIEAPDEREKAAKPRTGQISLKAYHQAGNIVIEITDDGKGLNKERILRKAIQNGIVRKDQTLSEQEIFHLIFAAGLSTAEKVTDVSGRGVGMDVVKRNVESLRGRIDIVSEEGKGSTFTIRLPLTLAVIDGLVVKVGTDRYIIPITSIEQSLRPLPEQISTIQNRTEVCMVRDRLVPVVRLHKLFNTQPVHQQLTDGLLVVVHNGAARCCLLVDELLGQQQVVIKSLGHSLGEVKGISGGAILGDGNVSLILDVPGLLAAAAVN